MNRKERRNGHGPAAAEPKQQQALPPITTEETFFPSYDMGLGKQEDGSFILSFTIPGAPPLIPTRVFVFGLGAENAQKLGSDLLAPSIVIPDGATFPDGSPLK